VFIPPIPSTITAPIRSAVTADINALQAVYQNNGFSKAKITSVTSAGESKLTASGRSLRSLSFTTSRRVNNCEWHGELEGNDHVDAAKLTPEMNTVAGQLLSPEIWPETGMSC